MGCSSRADTVLSVLRPSLKSRTLLGVRSEEVPGHGGSVWASEGSPCFSVALEHFTFPARVHWGSNTCYSSSPPTAPRQSKGTWGVHFLGDSSLIPRELHPRGSSYVGFVSAIPGADAGLFSLERLHAREEGQ